MRYTVGLDSDFQGGRTPRNMGEFLGLSVTHHPGLIEADQSRGLLLAPMPKRARLSVPDGRA
jgi:hypothetical protein